MTDTKKQSPKEAPQRRTRSQTGAKKEPAPMTQEEVDTMAEGGDEAEAIAERLAARSKKASSEKESPERLSAEEMDVIRESGEAPEALHDRTKRLGRPQSEDAGKQAPTQSPPQG
jgi:hypothetical protein